MIFCGQPQVIRGYSMFFEVIIRRLFDVCFFCRDRSDNPVSTPNEPTTPQDKGTYGQNRRTTRTMGRRLNMQPEKPTHSKTRNRHPPAHAQNNAAKLIRHAMQRIRHAPN